LDSVNTFFKSLTTHIQTIIQKQGSAIELLGVGVGAPGHSLDSGTIIDAVNLPFSDPIPVGPYLEDLLGVPSFVIKDSKAAVLGEKRWGAGQSIGNFVLMMLGTGLGYAACVNGNVINGMQGLAGELGHIKLVIGGRQCNCGKEGCLETYVSATGLKRTAFELLATQTHDSELRNYSFNEVDVETIAAMARRKDPIAMEAFRLTGKYLGIQMANIAEQMAPELFLLAGGLAKSGDLIMQPARESLRMNIQPVYRDRIKVQFSTLGSSEVGLLGAAALALENIILQS